MELQIAKENELKEILELQYLAYQSESDLFGTNDIPPLKQRLEEVEAEYREGTSNSNGRFCDHIKASDFNVLMLSFFIE